MRQEIARANKGWALDSVVLSNTVLRQTKDEYVKPPTVKTLYFSRFIVLFCLQEGVLVYGLFLEGAGWDRRNSKLCESNPKVISVPMPLIHIKAINTQLVKKDPTIGFYEVGFYFNFSFFKLILF